MTVSTEPDDLPVVGPLSTCLDVAAGMLATTSKWGELLSERPDPHRAAHLANIHVAEVPRHAEHHYFVNGTHDSGVQYTHAIIHFDDAGVASTFSHHATGNEFIANHTIVVRLYLVPSPYVSPDNINTVERWVNNTVGRIIRGHDPESSPGLLDLSHRPGWLMIRQLEVLGPTYPTMEQRAAGQSLYAEVELILQIGFGG